MPIVVKGLRKIIPETPKLEGKTEFRVYEMNDFFVPRN